MVMARREVEELAAQLSRLYDREHQVAETLQRSFLPQRLPTVDGTTIAARYVAGSGETAVGGDWYDAVPAPDGSVVLVIGDVEGSGVAAAAAMSQLRNSLRAFLFEGVPPAEALRRLSRLVERSGEERFATVLCVALRPEDGELSYARAGHLPALIVGADRTTTYLDQALSPPTGIDENASVVEVGAVLEPGSTLILYTDGLVERRDASIDDGLHRLAKAAATEGEEPGDLVDRLVDELGGVELQDDIAILAVRREAPVRRLRLRLASKPASAAALRHRMTPFLQRLGLAESALRDVLLAVSEAATNAIEHPQDSADEHFEVAVDVIDGDLCVVVRDFGQWKEPQHPTERGRGLPLMEALMQVEVARGPGGTVVTLRTPLFQAG
jgi:anti-sigma regulatory factor (Ser/Thr protein kinase)